MSDEEFFKSYQRLDNLRKACKLNRINTYDTLAQLARALSISNGDEKGALNVLSAKLNKADKKRVHSTTASRFDTSGSHNIDEYEEQAAEFVEDKAEKSSPKGYESEDEDDKPVRKCLRLEGDSSVKSAGDLTNQDVKDVFTSYTEQQRTEERPTDNKTHRLVLLIRNARTMCLGNQFLVDELAKFGKRCFDARKGSLGTFYLRAARQLQLTDIEITSGSQARKNMAFVGSAIAGKIDQILQSEDGDGIDDVEDNSNCRGALSRLVSKYGQNKRPRPSDANSSTSSKKSKPNEESNSQQSGEESMAPHKTIRLVEEAREKPAANSANQRIVDAFANYGEEQLDQGHTGKGVSHLRAALHIRDYPDAITSAKEARAVPMVGSKMAYQIEQVLETGKVKDDTSDQNVSNPDVDEHQRPELVNEIHNSRAKCPENQILVDELTKFGEHELYFGSTGKGTPHLRAARELQLTDTVINSGSQARTSVPLVGDVIADKIDQIRKHGRIVKDTGEVTGSKSYSRGSSGGENAPIAPIVKDLLEKPAACPENQQIVNALVDYGDSHLNSGSRGKGISHLRAAQGIRDTKTVVKSGRQASKEIDMVGPRVAQKIDQILKQGHADSDEDYEYEEEDENDEENEYGVRERDPVVPPIVQDVASKPAKIEQNQLLVDGIVEYGEDQLYKRHTSRGLAFLRAARKMRDADVEIKSGADAKKLGGIGDMVSAYVDKVMCNK
ncbi:hypothetical protein PHYBOEH_005923 [Phytophthora boehmeriae]|uniref:Crossover junction endonuclease MUS81-like HHH domain-containing protein n=1 Tax=Phytophthora boehmeriae TaxID=109152 RepID=A0A8T1WQ73_9STRA|nr:hypothetical protein PHYBOEH_005923 [Phytophthora boehmeriae]